MSRRLPLKMVSGNQKDTRTPDAGEAPPPRDPRALTRPDWLALLLAGLALFLMTLVVNALASMVVSRSRSGAATEI